MQAGRDIAALAGLTGRIDELARQGLDTSAIVAEMRRNNEPGLDSVPSDQWAGMVRNTVLSLGHRSQENFVPAGQRQTPEQVALGRVTQQNEGMTAAMNDVANNSSDTQTQPQFGANNPTFVTMDTQSVPQSTYAAAFAQEFGRPTQAQGGAYNAGPVNPVDAAKAEAEAKQKAQRDAAAQQRAEQADNQQRVNQRDTLGEGAGPVQNPGPYSPTTPPAALNERTAFQPWQQLSRPLDPAQQEAQQNAMQASSEALQQQQRQAAQDSAAKSAMSTAFDNWRKNLNADQQAEAENRAAARDATIADINQRAEQQFANEDRTTSVDSQPVDSADFLHTSPLATKIDSENQAREQRNQEAFRLNDPNANSNSVDVADANETSVRDSSPTDRVVSADEIRHDESDNVVFRALKSSMAFAERSLARTDLTSRDATPESHGMSPDEFKLAQQQARTDQNSTVITRPDKDLFWFRKRDNPDAPLLPVHMPTALKEIMRDPAHPASSAASARDRVVSALHDFTATLADNGYEAVDMAGQPVDMLQHYADSPVTLNSGEFRYSNSAIAPRNISLSDIINGKVKSATKSSQVDNGTMVQGLREKYAKLNALDSAIRLIQNLAGDNTALLDNLKQEHAATSAEISGKPANSRDVSQFLGNTFANYMKADPKAKQRLDNYLSAKRKFFSKQASASVDASRANEAEAARNEMVSAERKLTGTDRAMLLNKDAMGIIDSLVETINDENLHEAQRQVSHAEQRIRKLTELVGKIQAEPKGTAMEQAARVERLANVQEEINKTMAALGKANESLIKAASKIGSSTYNGVAMRTDAPTSLASLQAIVSDMMGQVREQADALMRGETTQGIDVKDTTDSQYSEDHADYTLADPLAEQITTEQTANARLASLERKARLQFYNNQKFANKKPGEFVKASTMDSEDFIAWEKQLLAGVESRADLLDRALRMGNEVIAATTKAARLVGETMLAHFNEIAHQVGLNAKVTLCVGRLDGERVASVEKQADGSYRIVIDADKYSAMPDDARYAVLAHELGHVVTDEVVSGFDTKVLGLLRDDFRNAAAKLPADHPYNKNGETAGFDEYLADQFSAFLRGRRSATSRSGRAFTEVKHKLSQILKAVSNFIFGRERLEGTALGYKFMDSVFRAVARSRQGETAANTKAVRGMSPADLAGLKFDRWLDEAYKSDEMVKRTREQLGNALGLSNSDTSATRDFDLRQAAAKAGGVARMLVDAGLHPMNTARTIASKVNELHHAMPIFITARQELKDISKGLADKYDKVFDNHQADNDAWGQRITRLFKSLNDSEKQELADYINGQRIDVPQKIREYLDALYAHVKTDLPTLNYLQNHFPRIYNIAAITDNKNGFINLVNAAAARENIRVDAESVYDNLINGRTLFTTEIPAEVSAHGSTFQSSKQRVLEFVTDAELRQAGFLDNNVEGILRHYTNKALRSKHFAAQFAEYTSVNYRYDWVKDRFPEIAFSEQDFDINFHAIGAAGLTPSQMVQRMHDAVNRKILTWMMDKAPLVDTNGNPIPKQLRSKFIHQPSSDDDFFQMNAPYIAQLVSQNWIKLSKGVANSVDIDFFDQNAKLRTAVEHMPPQNQRRVSIIVDAFEGRLAADKLSPKARNFMSNIAAYQNVLLMAFSSFTSLADAAGLVFKGADLASASKNLAEIGSIIRNLGDKDRLQLYKDLGYAEHRLASQAFLDSFGIQYQSPTAQKVNDLLFTLNGQIGMTNAMRIMAASMAERHIADIPNMIQSHDPVVAGRAKDMLNDLGISMQDVVAMNDPQFKHYNEYVDAGDTTSPEALQAFRIHSAMNKYVGESITRPDARMRPVWGSDPRFMLVFQYKAFMFAYWEGIMKPLFAQAKRNMERAGGTLGAIGQGAQAAAVFAIPVLALSAVGLWMRQWLQYSMWGQQPPTEAMTLPQYTYEVIKRGGILGPLEMGTSYIQDATNGRANAVSLFGPTASHIDTLMSLDTQRIFNRSVPGFSQIPALRNYTKGMFN